MTGRAWTVMALAVLTFWVLLTAAIVLAGSTR